MRSYEELKQHLKENPSPITDEDLKIIEECRLMNQEKLLSKIAHDDGNDHKTKKTNNEP